MRGCSLLLNESFQQECRKVAGETAPVLNGGKKAVATMIRRCQCCNDSVSSFLVRSTSAVWSVGYVALVCPSSILPSLSSGNLNLVLFLQDLCRLLTTSIA
jgi:hypothetical protein